MADEPFITRKDLEDVTQKVTIHNSKDIAKPLIDQQKNNDLKELERSIEQRAIFQDIADGIKDLADSLLEGLKGLIPKDGSSFAQILALGAAGVAGSMLRSVKDVRNTFAAMKKNLKNSKVGKSFAGFLDRFKNFFKSIFSNLKNSKLGTFFKNNKTVLAISAFFTKAFGEKGPLSKLGRFFKNNKTVASIGGGFKKAFGKGGFLSKLGGLFTNLKDVGKSGPLKSIFGMIKGGGAGLFKLLGKIFWPLTIIFGVIDFYNGFQKGYSEGGIIEGIKQGIQELFDGLIGGILRLLSWIPENIAKLLGLNQLSKAIGKYTETVIKSIKDIFGGLVDLIVGIFTWDTNKMSGGLEDIWDAIVDFVFAQFSVMGATIEDIFNIDLDDIFGPITDAFDNMGAWFSELGAKIDDFFSMETIDKFLNKLQFWKSGEEGADATKIFNEQMKQNKPFLQNIPGGSNMANPSMMASSTNNNDNSATVINNNHFHGTSNNTIAAMQRAFA